MSITDEQLEELARLEKLATPGPWRVDDPSWIEMNDITVWCGLEKPEPDFLCNVGAPVAAVDDREAGQASWNNGALIAAARNLLPALLERVRAQRWRTVAEEMPPEGEWVQIIQDGPFKLADHAERDGEHWDNDNWHPRNLPIQPTDLWRPVPITLPRAERAESEGGK